MTYTIIFAINRVNLHFIIHYGTLFNNYYFFLLPGRLGMNGLLSPPLS